MMVLVYDVPVQALNVVNSTQQPGHRLNARHALNLNHLVAATHALDQQHVRAGDIEASSQKRHQLTVRFALHGGSGNSHTRCSILLLRHLGLLRTGRNQ